MLNFDFKFISEFFMLYICFVEGGFSLGSCGGVVKKLWDGWKSFFLREDSCRWRRKFGFFFWNWVFISLMGMEEGIRWIEWIRKCCWGLCDFFILSLMPRPPLSIFWYIFFLYISQNPKLKHVGFNFACINDAHLSFCKNIIKLDDLNFLGKKNSVIKN